MTALILSDVEGLMLKNRIKFSIFSLLVFSLLACTPCKQKLPQSTMQETTYKTWVLSYCLSKIAPDAASKQDTLNTASAYFEQSNLPIEAFNAAEPLIQKYLDKNYTGSIPGTFNTKKCLDLYQSDELSLLYKSLVK